LNFSSIKLGIPDEEFWGLTCDEFLRRIERWRWQRYGDVKRMGAIRHAINAENVDQDFLIMACTDEEQSLEGGGDLSILDRMAAKMKKEKVIP
jgi:hypothetical protein